MTVRIAPHAVFVYALAHVPLGSAIGGLIIVLFAGIFELTVDKGHLLVKVGFVVLKKMNS